MQFPYRFQGQLVERTVLRERTHVDRSWSLPGKRAFYGFLIENRSLIRFPQRGCVAKARHA